MYDNAPQETRYIYTDFDSASNRLNGAGNAAYTVTFPKDQAPPVNGFWSLTLYNKEHMFTPNRLSRFSLGTKNKFLKPDDDGSLTIIVQHDSPGADKEPTGSRLLTANSLCTSGRIGQKSRLLTRMDATEGHANELSRLSRSRNKCHHRRLDWPLHPVPCCNHALQIRPKR